MRQTLIVASLLAIAGAGSIASGELADFDNETEGLKGPSFTTGGITFFSANNNSGLNPDGSTFGPGDYGSDIFVENATFAYNDYPGVLSPFNALVVGRAFVPGDNLTINLLTELFMSTNSPQTQASLDLVYYENGPWGGIQVHLDALNRGAIVATDSLTISDLGGRDNTTSAHLAVGGVEFDTLRLHATFADGTESVFATLIDNVSMTPAPGGVLVLAGGLLAGVRRRR